MQKRWLCLLTALVLCATLILLPGMTASAESGGQVLTVSVSLMDHQGHETHRLADGTVWAVIRLAGYASDVEAASVLLDLGSNAVGLDGEARCLTPYDGVEAFVGQEGTVLSVMTAGTVTAAQLDAKGGELCRVELTRTAPDADEDALLRVLERSGMVFTDVSLAGDEQAAAFAEGCAYAVGNGADPSSPGGTLLNKFTGNERSDGSWSFYKSSLLMSTALPNGNSRPAPDPSAASGHKGGEPVYTASNKSWLIGVGPKEELTTTTMTSKDAYDLSHGFSLSFQANRSGYTSNFTYETRDMLFAQIGDYTFTMKGAVTPQILYGGKQLAGADAKWTVADLSSFANYNNGSTAYSESAAVAYNALDGGVKDDIEDNIKKQWKTQMLSGMSFTISYDAAAKKLTFTRKATSQTELTLTCTGIEPASLRDAAITFGTNGAFGTCLTVASPVLTVTAADYSVSEATCDTAGAWTASNSDSKAIEAAHSFTCVAESGRNRLYQCSVCGTYSYEQGTVVMDKIPLTDCTVSLASEIVFKTGNPITPGVTVSFGGLTLTPETDYTVAYRDNTEVGTATVTVTAANDGLLSGSTEKTFRILLAGDVNLDNKVDAADYARIKSHLSGKKPLPDAQLAAADLNGDGVVNADDAAALWNKLLRKAG